MRKRSGNATLVLGCICVGALGYWFYNFEVKITPRQPFQMLPDLMQHIGGLDLSGWTLSYSLLLFITNFLANRLILCLL